MRQGFSASPSAFSRLCKPASQQVSAPPSSCPCLGLTSYRSASYPLEAPSGDSGFLVLLPLSHSQFLCAELSSGAFSMFLPLLLWKPVSIMSHESMYSTPHPVAPELCFTSMWDSGGLQASCAPPGAHVFFLESVQSQGAIFYLFPCSWGRLAGQLSVSPSEGRVLGAGMFAACLPPPSIRHHLPHRGGLHHGFCPAPDVSCEHLTGPVEKIWETGT